MLSTRLGNIRKDSLRIHTILLLRNERYFGFRSPDYIFNIICFSTYPTHNIVIICKLSPFHKYFIHLDMFSGSAMAISCAM